MGQTEAVRAIAIESLAVVPCPENLITCAVFAFVFRIMLLLKLGYG